MKPNQGTETLLIGLIQATQAQDQGLVDSMVNAALDDKVLPLELLSAALGMIIALLGQMENLGFSTDKFLEDVALMIQSGAIE